MEDRVSLNNAAWALLDSAHVKTKPSRKRKLTPQQQAYVSFKRSEELTRRKRLNGSQGPAGPCRRIDPLTGETIGIVKKPRRKGREDGQQMESENSSHRQSREA